MANDFLKPPETETPEIAWAGPVKVSYYPGAQRLLFEAVALRGGQEHVTRSFTLLLPRLRSEPAAKELIERALRG